MAIQNLQQFTPNYNYQVPFGSLTGAKNPQGSVETQQPQFRQAQKISEPKELLKQYSTQEIDTADAIAQAFAPQETNQGFFEGLFNDIKEITSAARTMFGEPTKEELAQGFKEIDSYSSLRPENYYQNVDSNKEIVPVYNEDIYQLMA